jgi:hypothetical protein
LLLVLAGCGGTRTTPHAASTAARGAPGVVLNAHASAITRAAAREIARQCGPGSSFSRRMTAIGEHGLSVEVAVSGGIDRAGLRQAVDAFASQLNEHGSKARLTISKRPITLGALARKLYDELAATSAAEPCDATDAAKLGQGREAPVHRAPL